MHIRSVPVRRPFRGDSLEYRVHRIKYQVEYRDSILDSQHLRVSRIECHLTSGRYCNCLTSFLHWTRLIYPVDRVISVLNQQALKCLYSIFVTGYQDVLVLLIQLTERSAFEPAGLKVCGSTQVFMNCTIKTFVVFLGVSITVCIHGCTA